MTLALLVLIGLCVAAARLDYIGTRELPDLGTDATAESVDRSAIGAPR